MPVYQIQLPDGKTVPFQSDNPPTEEDYNGVVAATGGKAPVVDKKAAWEAAGPIDRLKMLVEHPIDKYMESVHKASAKPEGYALADIPRIETSPDTNTPTQVAAGVANLPGGLVNFLQSPGGASVMLNPIAAAYSTPAFIADALGAGKKAVTEGTPQERTENALMAAMILGGAKGAAKHVAEGVKGVVAPVARGMGAPAPDISPFKEGGITAVADQAAAAKTANESSALANEIATKKTGREISAMEQAKIPEPVGQDLLNRAQRDAEVEARAIEEHQKQLSDEAADVATREAEVEAKRIEENQKALGLRAEDTALAKQESAVAELVNDPAARLEKLREELKASNAANLKEDAAIDLRARTNRELPNVQAGLGTNLEGFQPTELKAPMEFESAPQLSNEVQAQNGLDFLTRVKDVQTNLAKVGVELDRTTARKMALLSPEEFVVARQQLIDSVPAKEPIPTGNVKLKSLSDLEPSFFPPGEDFPQGTPQRISATDKVIKFLESKKLSEPGQVFSAESAIFVKSWDLAIDAAIVAIKAGRSVAEATKTAIAKFKESHPAASDEHIGLLSDTIRSLKSEDRVSTSRDVASERSERVISEDAWRPFLTDFSESALAQRDDMLGSATRAFGETGVAHAIETGAKLVKNLGLVSDNIKNVSMPVAGLMRKMDSAIGERIVNWWDKSKDGFAEARKVFGKDFDELSRALVSRTFTGDSGPVDAIVARTPGGAAALAKIESNGGWRGVADDMFASIKNTRQGDKELESKPYYYPLVVAEGKLPELMKAISKDIPKHDIELALSEARKERAKELKQKDYVLTPEEEGRAIGDYIYGTLYQGRGSPGFIKKRSIGEVENKIAQFFEPIDVAAEKRIAQVARDVSAREFFGKLDPNGEIAKTDFDPVSPVGQILAKEIRDGKISSDGLDVIADNIKDYFSNNRGASAAAWKFNRFMGNMAVFAHMNDFATAAIQAVDVFTTAAQEGPIATGKAVKAAVGHRLAKIKGLESFSPESYTKLSDIGVHEGAMDTAEYARGSGKQGSFTREFPRVMRGFLKYSVGVMDTFGKEVKLNAARIAASEAARGGSDPFLATRDAQFDRITKVMSEMHPDEWPQMKEVLASEGFAKGDLNEIGKLYLRERLADAQPIGRAEQAQGKLAAHPGLKPIFALKGYMLKEMGKIRNNTYEEMKRGNIGEAAKWFGVYAAWVVSGNFIIRCIVSKAQGKDCNVPDAFVSGLTGLFGVNRHTMSTISKEGPAQGAIDMFTPPMTVIKSGAHDLGLLRDAVTGRKWEGTGKKVVGNLGDFGKQSELLQNVPLVGRELYSLLGAGRARELERRAAEKRGVKPPTTISELGKMINPPPKKK